MLEMHLESVTVELIEAEKNLSRVLANTQKNFETLKQQMEKLAVDLVSGVHKLNGIQVTENEPAQAEVHIPSHYDSAFSIIEFEVSY